MVVKISDEEGVQMREEGLEIGQMVIFLISLTTSGGNSSIKRLMFHKLEPSIIRLLKRLKPVVERAL